MTSVLGNEDVVHSSISKQLCHFRATIFKLSLKMLVIFEVAYPNRVCILLCILDTEQGIGLPQHFHTLWSVDQVERKIQPLSTTNFMVSKS
jgi:hypothetical protein